MNLDPTPIPIRRNRNALREVFNQLEDFTDIVGGQAWRERRIRSFIFARSMALYLDEDSEQLSQSNDPDHNKFILSDENDIELISVKFQASRIAPQDNTKAPFTNLYELTFSHELPLADIHDIPLPYREKVEHEIQLAREEEQEKSGETGALPDISDNDNNLISITEERTTTYTLVEADNIISYQYEIDYNGPDFSVEGQMYNSHEGEIETSEDEFAYDRGLLTPTEVERINATATDQSLSEELAYEANMISLEQTRNQSVDLVGHSENGHAIRVLALLSILKSNLTTTDEPQ